MGKNNKKLLSYILIVSFIIVRDIIFFDLIYMDISEIPIYILSSIFPAVLIYYVYSRKQKEISLLNYIIFLLFIIYIDFVCCYTGFLREIDLIEVLRIKPYKVPYVSTNFDPFNTIIFNKNIDFILWGNIALLFPLGVFIKLLTNKNILGCFIMSFLFSLSIETYQFITTYLGTSRGLDIFRTFNVDDIILNVLGCIMGYLVGILIKKFIMPKIELLVTAKGKKE